MVGLQWLPSPRTTGDLYARETWTITLTFWFDVPAREPEAIVPEFPIDTLTITSVIAVFGFIVKPKLRKKKEDY